MGALRQSEENLPVKADEHTAQLDLQERRPDQRFRRFNWFADAEVESQSVIYEGEWC
jgi:hypothetical protein